MKKGKKLMVFLFLFAIILFDFSNTFGQAKKAEEPAALFYEISGNGLKKPSYLFGTIHIICTPDMIPMEKLDKYLGQTEQLIMELDMDNPEEMAGMKKSVLISGGKTFTDILTPEQLAKIDELMKSILGIPVERVKSVKPLMLSVLIISSPKVLGCDTPDSYDLAFLKSATAKKKPIMGLETVAQQTAVLDSESLEKQAKSLYEMALDPQKSFADFKKLQEAYKMQNSDTLYEVIISLAKDDLEFHTRLVDTRNRDWIPKIEKAIAEKPSFIAVGGGHLGGKNGLINLLREKGYKVQAIKL